MWCAKLQRKPKLGRKLHLDVHVSARMEPHTYVECAGKACFFASCIREPSLHDHLFIVAMKIGGLIDIKTLDSSLLVDVECQISLENNALLPFPSFCLVYTCFFGLHFKVWPREVYQLCV